MASKAVVVCGAGLPLSMNENGKKPGRDGAASLAGGGLGSAAGGVGGLPGAAPDLGCGAGVGSGTFSADADSHGEHGTYCRREDRRRAPSRHNLLLPYLDTPRRNPLIARYGEFAATGSE